MTEIPRPSERRVAPPRSNAQRIGMGDMTIEFNSLTGDVTVTGVAVVEPIEPGKVRLSSKRRDGSTGVGVG